MASTASWLFLVIPKINSLTRHFLCKSWPGTSLISELPDKEKDISHSQVMLGLELNFGQAVELHSLFIPRTRWGSHLGSVHFVVGGPPLVCHFESSRILENIHAQTNRPKHLWPLHRRLWPPDLGIWELISSQAGAWELRRSQSNCARKSNRNCW